MKFKNHKNKCVRPYIVYADSECFLTPSDDEHIVSTHTPNSACFYFVCAYADTQNRLWVGYGENCIYDMVTELIKLAEECSEKMRKNQEMELSIADKVNFCRSETCHICDCEFNP